MGDGFGTPIEDAIGHHWTRDTGEDLGSQRLQSTFPMGTSPSYAATPSMQESTRSDPCSLLHPGPQPPPFFLSDLPEGPQREAARERFESQWNDWHKKMQEYLECQRRLAQEEPPIAPPTPPPPTLSEQVKKIPVVGPAIAPLVPLGEYYTFGIPLLGGRFKIRIPPLGEYYGIEYERER